MELPEQIAGVNGWKVREMFKALMKGGAKFEWKRGIPKLVPREVTPDLIESSLDVTFEDAPRIHAALVAEGWIESDTFVLTRRGMALAQHVDRERISRAEAEKILDRVLDWADRVNAAPDARVKVKSICLYGSLERGEPEVGDIDLFIEFTTLELGGDLQPEDMDLEDGLAEELVGISEYISASCQWESAIMSDVPRRQVFPRSPERGHC